MKYIYNEKFYGIETVKMEYCTEDKRLHLVVMIYDEEEMHWYIEVNKQIIRYKFVINDVIRLNDPKAAYYIADDKWEVWSVPGECCDNIPKLKTYNISNAMNNGVDNSIKKTDYIYDRPIDIYIGVKIGNVKGVHTLTLICFQPDGSIYMLEESTIGQFEQKEADYEVIFKSRIARIQGRHAEGMWSVQMYLDGKLVIKDYLVLKKKITSEVVLFDCKM